MSGLESAALRVGGRLVAQVAATWLRRKRAEHRRGAELTELIAQHFDGLRERDRRALRRKFEEVAELAGARLEELCEREFAGLDAGERVAALDAVVEALTEADLSDAALLGSDLDPISLARRVKHQVPSVPRRAGLAEPGRALFDLALDQCCVHLVHLVRELPEFDSRLAEESLRRASAALAGIDDVLDRLPVTSLDAPGGTGNDEQFGRRYRDLMAQHHDDLELIGVSVRNFRPRTRLSVAYLSLTVHQRDPVNDASGELWFADHQGHSTPRVEAALARSDRTLVRGEAGSGKSTLLRWVAVQAARGNFGPALAAWNDRVPILIKLRSYSGRTLPHPEHFLDGAGPMLGPVPEGWTHRQLLAGRVLLLVDGVDELTRGERPKVQRWLDTVLTSYPETHIVVTSRPAAAGTRWLRSSGFSTVDLEHMTPADVQDFVDRWHRALLAGDPNALPFDHAEVAEHHRGLLSKLDARAHLRNLARSPLMCAMLCALNLDRGGDLPRDRKSLYEAALEMVLDRRETVRGIPASAGITLGYGEKLVLLQDLAFWLNLNGRSEIDRATALDRVRRKLGTMPGIAIEDEPCLRHLLERSGVVREPVEGRVDFVHRTFQEFLAAREAAEDGHVGLLVDKAHSDQWRETVIMAAGLLNRPGRAELLTGVLDRADRSKGRTARKLRLLAATCCESLHELPGETLTRVRACVDTLVPPRTTAESKSLSTVGESILGRLPTDLTHLSPTRAAACAYTSALVNGPESVRLLRNYAADPRIDVQDELIDAWPYFEPERYARTVLSQAPLHDGQILVRHTHLLPHLDQLRHLREVRVDIEEDSITDLNFVGDVAKLRSLRVFTGNALSASGLRKHQDLKYVTLLSLRELSDLAALRDLPSLTNLFVNQWSPLRDLDFLVGMEDLEFLRVGLDSGSDVRSLDRMHRLQRLILESDAPELALDRLPNPEELWSLNVFSEFPVSFESVVSRFPGLTDLTVKSPTDLDDPSLDRLVNLEQLNIVHPPPGASWHRIAALPRLHTLVLQGSGELDLSSLRNPKLRVYRASSVIIQGAPEVHRVEVLPGFSTESRRKAHRSSYRRISFHR